MSSNLTRILGILFIGLIIVSCANRGSPSGGEKDMDPPEILRENPPNFSFADQHDKNFALKGLPQHA